MENLFHIKDIVPIMSGKQYAPVEVLPGIPSIVMKQLKKVETLMLYQKHPSVIKETIWTILFI